MAIFQITDATDTENPPVVWDVLEVVLHPNGFFPQLHWMLAPVSETTATHRLRTTAAAAIEIIPEPSPEE